MSEKPTYEELEKKLREYNKVKAERDQAMAILQKSEEKYRLIAEQTADAIYTINIEREQFTYVSPAVERVFGHTPEECFELRIRDFLTDASYRLQREKMMQALERGERESEVLEMEAIHKDGHTLPIEVHAKFLFDIHGNPVEILGVARDITDRSRGLEERAELQRQLIQAQKMESIGRLAGGVAHDFNNMLGVIIGRSEMALKREIKDQSLTSDLQSILKVAHHSANLTRQLLTFARMQSASPEVIDLNEALADMLHMFRHLIGEDIELDWRPGAGLWAIRMDPSQVSQILANLCVNARDAISNVGRITIETENVCLDAAACRDHGGAGPGEYVKITFADTGSGMDPKILDFIFEPFFTTKGVGQGTGLGLSTVYGVVKQNKGFIEVSSEPDGGTTFRIYLPKYQGENEQISNEEWQPSMLHGNETILLVEDESTILEMTAMMLEGMGHTVVTAGGPSEAIRLVEENPNGIQLLITDVVMPEMNGKDLATEILSRVPGLKCLFMSGYSADALSRRSKLDSEVHFIQKPFTLDDLMPKVRAALDSA